MCSSSVVIIVAEVSVGVVSSRLQRSKYRVVCDVVVVLVLFLFGGVPQVGGSRVVLRCCAQ